MSETPPMCADTPLSETRDKPPTCQWSLDDSGGDSTWETQCGQCFTFEEDHNPFRFCGYCGAAIVEHRTSEDAHAR